MRVSIDFEREPGFMDALQKLVAAQVQGMMRKDDKLREIVTDAVEHHLKKHTNARVEDVVKRSIRAVVAEANETGRSFGYNTSERIMADEFILKEVRGEIRAILDTKVHELLKGLAG